MAYRTLDDMDLAGKRVLVRVDLNVPLGERGTVSDATRIEAAVPTIRDILAKGGIPVVLSHFGRPKGRPVPEMSLFPIRAPLERHLGVPVVFCGQCIGPEVGEALSALPAGAVLLLENTRFHGGEEKNDPGYIAALAANGDVWVMDAFSCAHRAHASTAGLARLLPACAGRSMEREIAALEAALTAPKRPVVAVVGGAKVSSKLDLLKNLVKKVDALVIGGGMANTFLFARGADVGQSLCEKDLASTARDIEVAAAEAGCEILLPVDAVVARAFRAGAPSEVVPADACPADAMILDAGPQSIARIAETLDRAATVVWNGPLGAFEIPPFNAATDAAALKVAELTRAGRLLSVAGGGDTVAALNGSGAGAAFSFVSTAGGAFLEWLEGRELPGVAALERPAVARAENA